MSDRDEGDNISSVVGSDSEIKEDRENSSQIQLFRGFSKEPSVVISRIDITPFLRPKAVPNPEDVSEPAPQPRTIRSILKQPSYDKFSAKCYVNIMRDDLDTLKDLIIKNSATLNNGSPSLKSPSIMGLTCKICEKVYPNSRKLLNHKNKKHMIIKAKSPKRVSFSDKIIVHELKEYHRCRKCPKIFENYKSLKIHMKVEHKKRKCYICNYCQKEFVDRMFFKVHMKLHCESCGELFMSKTKCILHKRSVCRILKLHECKTCNLSFFKLMDLKDHSYEHITTCYVCDICKDQCPTKCGIAHHIHFLHSKRLKRRNPSLYITRKLSNESLYLCKFCEESSVDRDLIEQHVQLLPDLNNRVMTGYKDYYFCDQCLKKFATEKSMLQHKWSHFLKKPDHSQVRTKNEEASNNNEKNNTLKTFYNINDKILEHFQPKNEEASNNHERNNTWKTFYNIYEKIPEHFQPTLVLEKIKVPGQVLTQKVDFIDVKTLNIQEGNIKKAGQGLTDKADFIDGKNLNIQEANITKAGQGLTDKADSIDGTNFNIHNGNIKKAIIDPKSRKTLISKHQCPTCDKYFSTNYCLNRHIETQHMDLENLHCKVCEETFVWPSLLKSHKCIRLRIPEMPFEDARPEIQIDNLHDINLQMPTNMINGETVEIPNGFDDFNITESDDYMNTVDFEIPAPIVEFAEYDNNQYIHTNNIPNFTNEQASPSISNLNALQSLGYKLVMQEVPIEF